MKIDFSGVEEFVPVPEGRYLAEVTRSEEGIAKSNQRKWGLGFRVVEAADGTEEFVGKTIKWDMSLQPKALWKVMQTIQALGEDVSKDDDDFEFDAENYKGRKCVMIVETTSPDAVYGVRTRVNRLESASTWAVAAAA